MIKRNNIYRWLFVLALLPITLTACLEDEVYGECPSKAEQIQLTLTLPEQTRIATNTRATSERVDYSIVNNLNLVLAEGTNIKKIYYFNENSITPDEGNIIMTRNTLPMEPEKGDNKRSITIKGEEGEFDKVTEIYAIANYNKAITVTTIDALKKLQQSATDGQPGKANDCMMFGSTKQLYNGKISLERTLAMFSVKIDGKNLNKGVRITPKRISLHNVPTSCFIGKENKIKSDNVSSVAQGQVVDVTSAEGWGALTNETKTVGGHELEEGTIPMFMFENLQGINDNIRNDQQVIKHPKDHVYTTPSALQKFLDEGQKYTYILVEAEYYYQDPQDAAKGVHGSINYRFLVGDNIYNDFNINRNTYYQVTLTLKDKGGASEDGKTDSNGDLLINDADVSWRVDMDIEDWGFVKSEFDFDCHADLQTIEILGNSDSWTIRQVTLDNKVIQFPNSWVKFYSEKGGYGGSTHWGDPANKEMKYGQNGKLTFYVEPWYYDFTTGDLTSRGSNKRYVRLELENEKGNKQYVTFYQWKPIKIANLIYMERFEEKSSLSWGYNNTNISLSNFTYGSSISTRLMIWNNALAMYNDKKSEAQIYCIEKGGYSYMQTNNYIGSPSGTSVEYCLPDQKTLELMVDFFKNNNSKITNNPNEDGIDGKIYVERMANADYWSVSVPSTNKDQTYIYSKEGVSELVKDRDTKRRARAVYILPYN